MITVCPCAFATAAVNSPIGPAPTTNTVLFHLNLLVQQRDSRLIVAQLEQLHPMVSYQEFCEPNVHQQKFFSQTSTISAQTNKV